MNRQLREYQNRFRNGDISGAVLYFPGLMIEPMALKFFSGDNTAWFVKEETFPIGKIKIIQIDKEKLLSAKVLRFCNKTPLMEGDIIILQNNEKKMVLRIKEGDGSPYPIIAGDNQYKWSEIKSVIHNSKKGEIK